MNFKHLALAFALLAGCASPTSSPSTWEYKTVTGTVIGGMPQQRLDAVINKHLAEGWKFVSAGQAADHWGFAVLKRKVKPSITVRADRPTNEIHAAATGHTLRIEPTATTNVSATGAAPFTYQWYFNGANATNAASGKSK